MFPDKKQHLVNSGNGLTGRVCDYLRLGAGAVETGSVKRRELRVELSTHDASQKQK